MELSKERKLLVSQLMGFRQKMKLFDEEGEVFELHGGETYGVPAHTLSAAAGKAILHFACAIKGEETPLVAHDDESQSAAVIIGNQFDCAEIQTGEDLFDIAIYDKKSGRVMATTFNRASKKNEDFNIAPGKRCGTVVLLAMLPSLQPFFDKKNWQELLDDIENEVHLSIRQDEDSVLFEHLSVCCDEVYFMFKEGKVGEKIPDSGKLKNITLASLQTGAYVDPDGEVYGVPEILVPPTSTPLSKGDEKAVDVKKAAKKFKMKRAWTEKEKEMIPELPTDRHIATEAVEICEDFHFSNKKTKTKIFSALLMGEPGTGKSTIAEDVFAMLGQPFVRMICNPETTSLDLVQQIMPNVGMRKKAMLPSADDLRFAPKESYAMLTGGKEMPEDFSQEELIDLLIAKAQEEDISSGDFISVDSPIVMAARYGYGVEVQECNLPKSSELENLNMLLEEREVYIAATGERFKVHDDFRIIFTMNKDLCGTRPMNQAIFDRCQDKFELTSLTVDEMVKRIVAKTNAAEEFVRKCVEIQKDISTYLNANYIEDGCVGVRATINWVTKTQICGDPVKAAMRTIVPSSSMDDEVQDYVFKTYIETATFPNWSTDDEDDED